METDRTKAQLKSSPVPPAAAQVVASDKVASSAAASTAGLVEYQREKYDRSTTSAVSGNSRNARIEDVGKSQSCMVSGNKGETRAFTESRREHATWLAGLRRKADALAARTEALLHEREEARRQV